MIWIGLALIGLTFLAFMARPMRGLAMWFRFQPMMEHFNLVVLPGLPTATYNLFTAIPLFFWHIFSGGLQRGWKWVPRHLILPLLLLSVVAFAEFWRSNNTLTQAYQHYLHRDVLPFLIFIVLLTTDWTKEGLRSAYNGLFLSLVAGAIVAIIENQTHMPLFNSLTDEALSFFPYRPTGPFMTIADLSMAMCLGLMILIPHVGTMNGSGKFFGRVGLVLIFVALGMAGFRGTLIPLGVLLFVWFWKYSGRRVLLGSIVLGIALAGLIMWQVIQQSELYQVRVQAPVENRMATYIQSFKAFGDQPLIGYGFGNSVDALADRPPTYVDGVMHKPTPHNAYFQILLEGGILGLGTVGLFFMSLFLVLRKSMAQCSNKDNLPRRQMTIFLLVQYLAINLSLTSYGGTTNMILFSCLGLGMAHARLEDEGICP